MKQRALFSFLVVFLLVAAVLSAQTGGTRELTIEELYLRNAEIRIIREQAITQDREMKLMAMENLQEMLDEGKLSQGSPEAHFILDYLAGEGVATQIRENNRLINYFPDVRRRAANLLGQIGGERAKDSLLTVLRIDNEPMVLSEAAYALGQIGMNPDNEVSQALAAAVLSQDVVNPDNNFAYAVLLAFEKIADANRGINDSAAFSALIRIAQGNYIRTVKVKAVEVLDKLRRY